MLYYKILPLIKLPLSKSPFFTYASRKEIPLGTIVRISFAKSFVAGVVFEKTHKPNFPTKEIAAIVEVSQLTKKQIELARFISEHYFSPLGIATKLFLQKLTKKETPPEIEVYKKEKGHLLTAAQQKAASQIFNNKKAQNFLIFGPASSGKTEVAMRVIRQTLKSPDKQVLVLVPEMFLAQQEILRYSKRFPEHTIALFHSNLKTSECTYIYNGIKTGKIRIVISTRAGLFLPFKSLGVVVVDEEQDISYKQWDQSPFYETAEVAQNLAEIHKAKTIFLSSTPSLRLYGKIEQKKITVLKLPRLKTKTFSIKKPQIVIVDLLKNYDKKQRVLLSPELKKAISENLEKNKISAILVPRRGKSFFSICQDCKKILLCPTCQIPLNHSGDIFRCFHCKYKKSVITKCGNCGSFRIVDSGIGTQSVQQELKKIHPEARISIADSDTFKDSTQRKKIFKQLRENNTDILVGTYSIVKGFDIPNITLVGVLNADNWSGRSDFGFDEHFLGNLFQLAGRVNRPKSLQNGKCIIQTFRPENKLLKILSLWDWEIFLKRELEARELLAYPPFSRFIKITLEEKTKIKVEKNANKVYTYLMGTSENGVSYSEPFFGYSKQKRGNWRISILIKAKGGKVPKKTRQKLFKVSSQWKIDADPRNVF